MDNCEIWKNVHITMRKNYSCALLFSIPAYTPNLQKLSILGPNFLIANLFDAPLTHLTHLRIDSPTIYSRPRTNFVLENLRSLYLRGAKHPEVVDCLSRSPRVEGATLTFKFTAEEAHQIPDRVCFKLEYLRRLELNVDFHSWNHGQSGPLNHIDLPALETLLLVVINCKIPNEADTLWDLSINTVSRYEATLKNLEMTVRCCGQPQSDFIGRIHGLKHLGVNLNTLSDDFIRALVSHLPSPKQQPCEVHSYLESLRILDIFEYQNGAAVSVIIDLAENEKSYDAPHPVTMILPSHFLMASASDSLVKIMAEDDWVKQRPDLYRPDLYRPMGEDW
ncbi:hypothetical protein BD410DRAFT_846220 [Rickenella mellea]|uniref:F-box domain-containing protein n=1 Tax=Rickenella mellea TaxID=50990 RepID=A0A4Y7PIJ0_9AGAM|nr:hypothetical protein BD410DRAFT_846220 [Rickenella mellea]